MTVYSEYRYSVTVQTDDLAVLHCLRAITAFAQETGNSRISWGNTKKSDWEHDGHRVTFHFTREAYRNTFLEEARRLLPKGLWVEESTSDSDPAQSAR